MPLANATWAIVEFESFNKIEGLTYGRHLLRGGESGHDGG